MILSKDYTSVGQLTGVRLLLALYIKGNVYKYKSMQVTELHSKLWIKLNTWNHTEKRLNSNSKISKIFGFESERCSPSTEMSPRYHSTVSVKLLSYKVTVQSRTINEGGQKNVLHCSLIFWYLQRLLCQSFLIHLPFKDKHIFTFCFITCFVGISTFL